VQILRRLVHVFVIVLTLVVGAAAAAVIVSQTAWFKNWLRGYIVREANGYLNGKLSIQRLGGNLFFGVEMENVGISMNGSQVVAVKDLGLDYNVFELITRGLSVDSIRLNQPVIYLRREGDTWTLSRLVKKQEQEADRSGPMKPITIDDIGVSDGSVVIDGPVGTSGVNVPDRVDHLDAKLNFKYEPVHYSIEITHVSFRGSDPELAVNALSGGVSVRDDALYVKKLSLRTAESSVSVDGAVQQYLSHPTFNLQVTSDKLSLPEIARLVPALSGIPLQPAFEVKAAGPLSQLAVSLNVRSSAGQATGRIVADLEAPGQAVKGDVAIRHLDLAPILRQPSQKSDITAAAKVDLRGQSFSDIPSLRGSVAVDAPLVSMAGYEAERIRAKANVQGRRIGIDASAAAYGASADAAGAVDLPASMTGGKATAASDRAVRFDLHGRVRRLDLARLPRRMGVPPAPTAIAASYHVAGAADAGAKRASRPNGGAPSGLSARGEITFDESTVGGAAIAPGSQAGFDVNGSDIAYSADARVSHLDLQHLGHDFRVAALDTPKYKTELNAHLVAHGRGTKPEALDATASGSLTDSSLLGGTIPRLDFDASLSGDTAHVKANGTFAGFDPAVASGRPALAGKVGGTLNVDATAAAVSKGVTTDSVQGSAEIELNESEVGGLAITRAKVDAGYRDASADIRTFDVVGRDVNVQASGTLALNDTGQSNLKVHADSPSLETIGKLVHQPLTGIGKVDATITGNRHELQAKGSLIGDGVKYGDNGALTLATTYTAKVPELDAARATATADTHATFVTLAGQNVNELQAKTDYASKQLDFTATAKQPQRSLDLAGQLVLHPDHQEVHLRHLALQSQGVTWETPSGSPAAIQYGNDEISVENLRLVSRGSQEITAKGAFGRQGDALHVTLSNMDLATVDAVLLRPPQLSGRLDASATIAGTKESPQIDGQFAVGQGGFRQFRYDSFKGSMKYAGRGMTVDARLQQNPSTWIEAKGYVPVKGLQAARGVERTHVEPTGPAEDRFDLHVDSSPIDIGLVQGFTTALINVKGTLQAKIDVTGAAADPHPTGQITLKDGAFNVVPTGVNYTNLDGRIDLEPDRVHVGAISVLDNHQNNLTISGDLAIHGSKAGGVEVYASSDDFKVIDNKMGNVRVNTGLRLTGELRAPRLEGDLGITTGAINLDPLIAAAADSAYATKPTEFTAPEAQGEEPAAASGFGAMAMNVHVTVPDDLVVKASDLRAPGGTIGLGTMNITLGGDIHITKDAGKSIRLVGPVNTVRGYYDFQSRRFTILRDVTIRFEGLEPPNPSLDIRAERVIQAVTARVTVRGTLQDPKIELSSTPPLEQADILSLIVFNQPANAIGEGQQISLAQRAQAMATGAVAGQLASSIGSALNLNEFEINTSPESGGGPQVTVGQQIGQNLYVRVQQGIGDQSQTNVVLEYELTKWLRLRTNVLQGSSTQAQLFQRMQGSGVDMLFFFSY